MLIVIFGNIYIIARPILVSSKNMRIVEKANWPDSKAVVFLISKCFSVGWQNRDQVDCSRGDSAEEVHGGLGRVELRHPLLGGDDLWGETLLGNAQRRGHRVHLQRPQAPLSIRK